MMAMAATGHASDFIISATKVNVSISYLPANAPHNRLAMERSGIASPS
jgi:hypothetical protein